MNEIYHEDAVTGAGMTDAQRQLRASVAKLPSRKRDRYGLAIQRRRGTTAGLTGLHLPDDLTVTLVYDSMSRRGPLRTAGMVCRFARSPFGLVGVDTRGRFSDRSGDLRLLPRRPVQLGIRQSNQLMLGDAKPISTAASKQQLLSMETGYFEVRRLGQYLDLCVGEIEPGVSMVQYRLEWFDFTEGKVAIWPADDQGLQEAIRELKPGHSLQLGWTNAEHPLAVPRDSIEYLKAGVEEEGLWLQEPLDYQLRWDSDYLSLFARLNNAVSVESDSLPEPIPVYMAYSPAALHSLPDDSRFTDCSLEVLDVLGKALSPSGYYGNRIDIRAPKTGKIVEVISKDDEQLVILADGTRLSLPPFSALSPTIGQVVQAGQYLGEYLPVAEYHEPRQLVTMFGRHLRGLAIAALEQLSIADQRQPDKRVWVPQQLVMSLDDQAEQRQKLAGGKEPLWALDLSGLSEHYDPVADAFILPSLPRTIHETQYWGSMGFILCDLEYPLRDRAAAGDRPQTPQQTSQQTPQQTSQQTPQQKRRKGRRKHGQHKPAKA